eukprot:152091_1
MMKPGNTQETDPLIKALIPPSRTPWRKRSVAFMTILLILFILYLIISQLSPSLRTNSNANRVVSKQQTHDIGTDPFVEWNECDDMESPPDIISYHVHAIFDGNDAQSVSNAYQIYHQFIDYMNPVMSDCSFAHSTAAVSQTEVCYFPNTWQETDLPIPTNFIFQTANYAFYIPAAYLQQTMRFWMQNHNEIHYVIHAVSGCQFNDHSKWLVASSEYDTSILVTDNLLCCHHGPAMCTCDIVQYQLNDNNECLSVQFDGNDASFVNIECESADQRNIGSWREMTYDAAHDWYQIENYGDVDHPMYLCLGIVDDTYCDIGADIQLMDCSYAQDIENDVWISPPTQMMYDKTTNQIKVLGCDGKNVCVNVFYSPQDTQKK